MRNIAKNTRRATAVTLAAALAVACYLNWQYAQTDLDALSVETAASAASQSASSEPSGKARITDALPTEAEAASSVGKNYGEAQLVSVANDTGSQFFDEARLKREKAHDEALDTIQKTLKDSSLSEQEKADYTAQMTAQSGGYQRRKRDRDPDQSQRLCRLSVLFAVGPGGSDRDDLGGGADRRPGGPDP